jgi:hypothetical protein
MYTVWLSLITLLQSQYNNHFQHGTHRCERFVEYKLTLLILIPEPANVRTALV